MATYEKVTLTRECDAVEIPSGYTITLPAGTGVTITQSLGGTYTVITDYGFMVRISERDADALGKAGAPAPAASTPPARAAAEAAGSADKLVWDQLKTCYDPEIPVNIVDLGLVYRCEVKPISEGGNRVEVEITLTAPGCGMGPILQADVQNKILSVPGVTEADVQVVFEPAWDPSRMSEAARLELGMM